MKFDSLHKIVRKNILALKPYASARDEFKGEASVYLDANENPYGSPLEKDYNRYPDPLQWQLKFQLARIKGVPAENIFVGNGSDEIIDLAYRIFCEPGKDNVIICPPTYGMYEVSANINNVEVRKVALTDGFQLRPAEILKATDEHTKLLFICSPNNPTGNSMLRDNIIQLLEQFPGIILVDEAYINYSRQKTLIPELTKYPNLVVMQTLSKAWGLAALRLGICYASMDMLDLFNKVKPPYNVNLASQQLGLQALAQVTVVQEWIQETVLQRQRLATALKSIPLVKKVYDSDANFLLVKLEAPDALYQWLAGKGAVVRNRSKEPLCEGCLRITVGTEEENIQLIQFIKQYNEQRD
ncbi:MAG: histidinol-phosphate transaminase [Ferruginibacter sp.]